MNKWIKITILILAATTWMYLVGCFSNMSFDISAWSEISRIAVSIICSFLNALVIVLILVHEITKPDP